MSRGGYGSISADDLVEGRNQLTKRFDIACYNPYPSP